MVVFYDSKDVDDEYGDGEDGGDDQYIEAVNNEYDGGDDEYDDESEAADDEYEDVDDEYDGEDGDDEYSGSEDFDGDGFDGKKNDVHVKEADSGNVASAEEEVA